LYWAQLRLCHFLLHLKGVGQVSLRIRVKQALQQLAGASAAASAADTSRRKTVLLPSILSPYGQNRAGLNTTPRPTAANLRKFAETPVARRAINIVKDRIASMDWKTAVRRGYADVPDAAARMTLLRRSLEEPNAADSFRTLIEQVLEDLLVAAFNDAKGKVNTHAESEMQKLTGGLALPGGMKLPF